MKIPKCSKTISGKHNWFPLVYSIYYELYIGVGEIQESQKEVKGKECRFCGLIDDRKPKHGKD